MENQESNLHNQELKWTLIRKCSVLPLLGLVNLGTQKSELTLLLALRIIISRFFHSTRCPSLGSASDKSHPWAPLCMDPSLQPFIMNCRTWNSLCFLSCMSFMVLKASTVFLWCFFLTGWFLFILQGSAQIKSAPGRLPCTFWIWIRPPLVCPSVLLCRLWFFHFFNCIELKKY